MLLTRCTRFHEWAFSRWCLHSGPTPDRERQRGHSSYFLYSCTSANACLLPTIGRGKKVKVVQIPQILFQAVSFTSLFQPMKDLVSFNFGQAEKDKKKKKFLLRDHVDTSMDAFHISLPNSSPWLVTVQHCCDWVSSACSINARFVLRGRDLT